jgi:hypothetical protein
LTDSAAGLGFGLAGTVGTEGLGGGSSCPGLKSRSRFGLGAGDIGREGGLVAVGTVGGETSTGLLTFELGEVPMFSNRARKDDTGFCRTISSDRVWGTYSCIRVKSRQALLHWQTPLWEQMLPRRGSRVNLPTTPTPSSLTHQGINRAKAEVKIWRRESQGVESIKFAVGFK